MAADDIHVRLCLQEIVKLDLEVKAFIQDIRECTDTLELENINIKAQEKIRLLRIKIEELERLGKEQDKSDDRQVILKNVENELERLGKEQDKSDDRQVILKNVENHRQRLTSNLASLRKINLSVKMSIDKNEKDELLSGGTRKRNINNKETLAKAANDITETLMELNQTMDAQVRKGNLTLTALESSSKTIGDTHEEFRSMGGNIQTSKKLLTKYGHRELTDKLLIFIALVFFFATVLYILKRRLWS